MIAPAQPSLFTLVDELLAEQQTLQTPVARFSTHQGSTPALAPVYRDLIPLSRPGPGEQYAFEVDLDSCSGCKACVTACHAMNGLDDDETWRDIGTLISADAARPFQQTITSACHHCADPGCLNGCPVLAYEKDPITGIVRHLDDQCIGCSYCILKCPYDVPKYSQRLGIVRKCDMCHSRLEEGEAPACVQACPTHAITIVKVAIDLSGPKPRVDTADFLTSAPEASFTQPTTRYVSAKGLPADLRAIDAGKPRVQPTHWPLVVLLTCTQTAFGLSTAAWLAPDHAGAALMGYAALVLAALGLGASGAHLGRPLRAWRIFLGLRRSWLSREAVLLGAWFPLLAVAVIQPPGVPLIEWIPLFSLIVGGAAIGCSAMIYIDTPRLFWRAPATTIRMVGTVAGAALLATHPLLAALVIAVKIGFEYTQSRAPSASGLLLRTQLNPVFRVRLALATGSLGLLVTYGVTDSPGTILAGMACWFAGELLERALYFRAVDASQMPGVPKA